MSAVLCLPACLCVSPQRIVARPPTGTRQCVPRINTPFMDYIRKHKTKIHVSDLAALTRAIAARGA